MPTLDAFIQSLTNENDKLIQMGIILSPKDQALIARGGKVANDKGKQRDESPVKKERSKEPLLLLWKELSFRKLLYEKKT